MTLSDELAWRGFIEQTTYKDIRAINGPPITFYWGVDPSADSMTVGNLATAMLVKHFMAAGHRAVLLVGGATGLIGDPDGKSEERLLQPIEVIEANKRKILAQYDRLFSGQKFKTVDNNDWFKNMHYLTFLRDVGKHMPMRQLLSREFVQTRLSEHGSGLSYAEFSYSLMQGYDYLRLYQDKGVTLQVAGSDQWGNAIAGVELVRRIASGDVNAFTSPLIVNKDTGQKYGKSEQGAIWLDPQKTTPTAFYQFWINTADGSVEDHLKIFTRLTPAEIKDLMSKQSVNPKDRPAQKVLAASVTESVHGKQAVALAEAVTDYLTGKKPISQASKDELKAMRLEIPAVKVKAGVSLVEALVASGLASSNNEARQLISSKAVYVNADSFSDEQLSDQHFSNGRVLIRRGKAFKDSALLEL